MKNDWIKLITTYVVGILVGGYKAFVLMLMWNWFVSPVFHTGHISFWQVLGLLWVVQLFVGEDSNENPAQALRWENLFSILDFCVPEYKREELQEELKQRNEGIWGQLGIYIFGQAFGYTFTLGLEFLLHTFAIG